MQNSVRNRYTTLIFAIAKAWPILHGSNKDTLKAEFSEILRRSGDFSDQHKLGPLPISEETNDRLYTALELAWPLFDDGWISESRREHIRKALEAGKKEEPARERMTG